jgi:hypothetical protein
VRPLLRIGLRRPGEGEDGKAGQQQMTRGGKHILEIEWFGLNPQAYF